MDKSIFGALTAEFEELNKEFNRASDWSARAVILERMAVVVKQLDRLAEADFGSFMTAISESDHSQSEMPPQRARTLIYRF